MRVPAFAAALLLALSAAPAAALPGVWVVRDADTEITLFGTIHALPRRRTGNRRRFWRGSMPLIRWCWRR